MLEGILTEGFIYGIMVLGVFITFRVLNFADMTVDGSFPLGACILGVLLSRGLPFSVALFTAFAGGMAAGLVTALIHTRLKIPDLLSGILTMTMLYSINLRVMSNRANLSLIKVPTLFSRIISWASAFMPGEWAIVIFCLLTIVIIKIALDLFFRTDFGLCVGALGDNPQLIISQGMNPDVIKIVGICLANGLMGIAGAYAAMYQGFSDINFGSGMIVSGLASLMIGEFLLRSNRIGILTLRAILGSVLYRALMFFARNYGYYIHMTANDLKLITGILIIVCIMLSRAGYAKGGRSGWGIK
ncbi:ABC transporter permease [Leadbettera azotonutricia]|uniref:ABC transporter, permease protein n=1 Tax=Leadbettera azotonutricia (strain ATCC BAA-888 / DSM 13862 / ZAS-9) TaxID=545695 RepID=F5YBQ7_LEAAZ|nr:ABC transporter permease [Leadbettera azotonutricia]AEF82123.1 ABC transporter, permease protein [Leadbettera azotonutricia ZAS-9]